MVRPDKMKKAADPMRQAANKVSSMLGGGNSSSYNSHMLRSNRQALDCLILLLVFFAYIVGPPPPLSLVPPRKVHLLKDTLAVCVMSVHPGCLCILEVWAS